MLTASIGSTPARRGPGEELVGADLVGLDRAPGQVEPPRARLARPDAVLPVVAGDEVAARVADDRDAQLADELEHVLADPAAVGLVDPAVDAAPHVLDERAEHALVDFRHRERGVDDQPGPLHAVNATSAGLAMFSTGEASACERYQAHAEGGSHRRRDARRRGCARRGEHRLAVRRHLADGDVLAPLRRRRRRAAGRDPRRDRRRARGQRRARADPAVGQPLLHEAGAGGGRRLAARRGRHARDAHPGLRPRRPAGGAHSGAAGQARPRGRPLPRAAVEERAVRRPPVRDPARHPPVRPLLQHRADREGGPARGRLAQAARRARRPARRVRRGQGGDGQDRRGLRDARRHAVAAVPDPLLADGRRPDHRRGRQPDHDGRRQGAARARVDRPAQQARASAGRTSTTRRRSPCSATSPRPSPSTASGRSPRSRR